MTIHTSKVGFIPSLPVHTIKWHALYVFHAHKVLRTSYIFSTLYSPCKSSYQQHMALKALCFVLDEPDQTGRMRTTIYLSPSLHAFSTCQIALPLLALEQK